MEMATGGIMNTRNSVKITRCLQAVGLILVLLISINVSAQGREVFRWVDENGVVHFTNKPPEAQEYDKIKPNVGKVGTVAAPVPRPTIDVSAQPEQADATSQAAVREKLRLDAEQMAIACQRASENVALLEPVTHVIVPDDAGGTRSLDDAERLDWLEKSKSFLTQNCN
jgi:hypothetical protein